MSEIDFLVNVRRIILSAIALLDKRIEYLKSLPLETCDEQAKASLINVANQIQKGN